MDIPIAAQVVISFAGNLLAAALQMIGRKLLGVALFVFSTGLLWWVLVPLMADKGIIDTQSFSLWVGGGWGTLIIIGILWAWAIVHFTPAPVALPHISSTQQSGGITANYGNIFISQVPPPKPERPIPQTDIPFLSLETQNDLIARLRNVLPSSGEQLKVTVEPKTQASYSFARSLAALFRSAGWDTTFRDPLDPLHGFPMSPHSMNRGMGIAGANTDLVMTVAGILRAAGCTGVSTVSSYVVRGDFVPKLNQDQHAIFIEISYRH